MYSIGLDSYRRKTIIWPIQNVRHCVALKDEDAISTLESLCVAHSRKFDDKHNAFFEMNNVLKFDFLYLVFQLASKDKNERSKIWTPWRPFHRSSASNTM